MSLAALTDALSDARERAQMLEPAAWQKSVATVADGYAVQTMLAQRGANGIRGWKVTALAAEQQRLYGSDRPVAGALFAPFVHAGPAALSLKRFVTPLLECEVSFRLGADLPPRDRPYTREEVEAAIDAVVPAMEIADSRWPSDAPDLLKLADSMGNGAFIEGTPVAEWRKFDLTAIRVTLTHEGAVVERGESARILGNPLLAVIALANCQSPSQPLPAGGLRRGQIITTGTCTTPIPPKAGRYIAEFDSLGVLRLDITA
jgi:2-keto-4-pentenoate hydratase